MSCFVAVFMVNLYVILRNCLRLEPICLYENEFDCLKPKLNPLKMKLSERKWNRVLENGITCIFFEIDTGMF